MNHTNKMILVPHEIVGENESITKYLSNLDQEMLHILNNESLPIDEKILRYNQILRKFQTVKQDSERPIKIEVQEPSDNKVDSKIKHEDKPSATFDELTEKLILETIPLKHQKQANLLLQYTRKLPQIEWSNKGEMIIEGNKIAGSNIIDLINDLSRDRKSEPPVGSDVLLKKLVEENIPKELIVNKKRLSMMPDEVLAAPNTSSWSPSRALEKTLAKMKSPEKSKTTSIFGNWTGLTG